MNILLFILVFFPGKQVSTNDTIHWCDTYNLKFDDFTGLSKKSSKYYASTHTEIITRIDSLENDEFLINLETIFIRSLSWLRNGSTPKLLTHEQIHFNLTEVVARRARKSLVGKVITSQNLKSVYSELITSMNIDLNELNFRYDVETNHGLFENQQKWWVKHTDEMLKELEEFSCLR